MIRSASVTGASLFFFDACPLGMPWGSSTGTGYTCDAVTEPEVDDSVTIAVLMVQVRRDRGYVRGEARHVHRGRTMGDCAVPQLTELVVPLALESASGC